MAVMPTIHEMRLEALAAIDRAQVHLDHLPATARIRRRVWARRQRRWQELLAELDELTNEIAASKPRRGDSVGARH